MRRSTLSIALVGISVASACASTPAPREKVASAQQAVTAAQDAGAARLPRANWYLAQAQSHFEEGNRRMKKGDNLEAADSFDQSRADAELAAAMARAASSNAAAEVTAARARALEQGAPPPKAVGGGPPSGTAPPPKK
jgi:uncharacterized protein DUF4398